MNVRHIVSTRQGGLFPLYSKETSKCVSRKIVRILGRDSVQLCRNSEALIFQFLCKVGTFLPNYTLVRLRKSYGTQHWLHKSHKFKYILAALRGADMPPLVPAAA